jgi:hypothetical protein
VLARPTVQDPVVEGLRVTLDWEPVSGAERYEVSRGGSTIADDVTGTSFTDEQSGVGRPVYTITAVDDGEGLRSSTDVSATVAPWGTMQPFASAFPMLLPPTPDGDLQQPVAPHTCEFLQPDGANAAVERVSCKFDNGITAVVDRFATAQQVADDFQSFNPGTVTTWNCRGGPTRGQFIESTQATGEPFELFTFVDPGLELFDLYVVWTGDHSVEELRSVFFESPILCD